MTNNVAESSFMRAVNRIKRVGRLWAEAWLLNYLAMALGKIFHPAMWTSLWHQYLRIHRRLRLSSITSEYRWIYGIK